MLLLSIVAAAGVLPVTGLTWSNEQSLGMATLSTDQKMKFVDASPSTGTALRSDSKLKMVDANGNGLWDPSEPVAYDENNNGRYDSFEPIIAGTPVPLASLLVNTRIRVVDTNANLLWNSGEAVVNDTNSNNTYESGEPIIGGTAPQLQAVLNSDTSFKFLDNNANLAWNSGEVVVYDTIQNGVYDSSFDPLVRFVDSNLNSFWDSGESVCYDSNGNVIYDPSETLISWTSQSTGAALTLDTRLRVVDTSNNGIWSTGEAVTADTVNNNKFDSGEPIIAGAAPSLQAYLTAVTRVKYFDQNTNDQLEKGEPVLYDNNDNGLYDASIDVKIRFVDSPSGPQANGAWDAGETVVYDRNGNLTYDCVDNYIAGDPIACFEAADLNDDPKFKFTDSNRNGVWDSTPSETIVYDKNTDSIYDAGDSTVSGTTPALGTLLRELLIVGNPPLIGSLLESDSMVKFSDANLSTFWDSTEALVRDANNDGVFQPGELLVAGIAPTTGTLLSEPVIAGSQPAVGSATSSDSRMRFVDVNSNFSWNSPEIVAYDANSNGFFQQGEPVMSGAAQGTNGLWNTGEVSVYDSNNDNAYNTGDSTVAGSSPPAGTPLRSDAKIRFFDDNNNNLRDPAETAVYDSNSNNEYDTGEPVLAGATPDTKLVEWPSAAPDPTGRIWLTWNEKTLGSAQNPEVFFRLWDGSNWLVKQKVTNDPATDDNNFVTPLFDGSMMIFWSSNRTGNPDVFYKKYTTGASPMPVTPDTQLTSNPLLDKSPSAVEDRNGRIWVAWARRDAAAPPTIGDVYYKYFVNGAWSAEFALPPASDPALKEASPFIMQTKDGKILIIWSSNDSGNFRLYSTTTDGTLDTLPATGIPAGSWTTEQLLFTTNDEDDHPVIVQGRDGVLWLFFQRTPSSGGGGPDVLSSSSTNNGVNWSSPTVLAGTVDTNPTAAQMGDNRIWVFWNRQGATTDEVWYSKSDPITSIHDVGVRLLTAVPKFIKSGDPNPIKLNVTVRNYGDFQEANQLTIKYNNTILTTIPLNLASKQTQLVQDNWTTTLGFWGKYVLTATVQTAAGENTINQGDNTAPGGIVRVSPPGDVDGDGDVDILDAAAVAYAYDTRPDDPLWNPDADIDSNSIINILDMALLAFYYDERVYP